MADNKPKIDYGTSDAKKAADAAKAFGLSSAEAAATYQQDLDRLSAELSSKIQTGMSADEKADLDQRLADVQTRYNQSITNMRSNYGFAQQQSQAMAGQTQRSLQDVQAAQQSLAAQSLGLAGYSGIPGGYSPTAVDAQRAVQQGAAANLALIGGEGAVPAVAQVRTPLSPTGAGTELSGGPGAGLIGLSKTAQDLFMGSLLGAEARSLSETEQQLTNIRSQYGLDAARAVRERVAREQADVRTFIIQGMQGLLSLKAQQSATQAQLAAAAAGADTRSGKVKSNAELDFYTKKANIDFNNQLKLIKAQASSRGASASQLRAFQDAANSAAGESSGFAVATARGLKNVEAIFSGKVKPPAGYKFKPNTKVLIDANGQERWKYEYGVLQFNSGTTLKPNYQDFTPGLLIDNITKTLGSLKGKSKDQQLKEFSKFFNQDDYLRTAIARQGLELILGPGASKPSFYVNALNNPLGTSRETEQALAAKAKANKQKQQVLPPLPGVGASSKKTTTSNTPYFGGYTGPRK